MSMKGMLKRLEIVVCEGACLELSKVLASSLRQNILRALSKTREINVMRLVSNVNSTYNEVNRNLVLLEREGIIINEYRVKVKHGKVRVIRLNKDNPKTKTLLSALKTLDNV
jgi:predicted transcriptional regulator